MKFKKTVTVLMAVLLLAGCCGLFAHAADVYEAAADFVYGQTEARSMLSMVNQLRRPENAWYWNSDNATKTEPKNLTDLSYDYGLEKVAMQRAAEIAVMFSHTRPDGTDCFSAYSGLTWYGVAENIAYGYSTAESVFEAWSEADEDYVGQGHRRNMLSSSVKGIAVGHVILNGRHYWVQEFITPLTGAAETVPQNAAQNTAVRFSTDLVSYSWQLTSSEQISLDVGGSAPLPGVTALVGNVPAVPSQVDYTVSPAGIAKVENGTVVGLSGGSAVLRVSAFGSVKEVPILVVAPPPVVYQYAVKYYSAAGQTPFAEQTKRSDADLTLISAKPAKSFQLTFDTTNPIASPAAQTRGCTFNNWNTSSDGTGTAYASGGIYKDNAVLTLYAQWTNPKAGTLPAVSAQTLDFLGWYTAKTGGTKITADSVITGDMTLYAHWAAKTCKVTYYPGGGVNAPAAQTKTYGKDLTLTTAKPTKSFTITFDANAPLTAPAAVTKACTFTGWNTELNGSGTAYASGAVYKDNEKLTLYAQWTNPTAGTLPTMSAQSLNFLGWYTEKTGGTKMTSATVIDKNVTLYAHWATKTYKVTYYPGGGQNAPDAQIKYHDVDLTLTTDRPTKSYTITFDSNAPLTAPASVKRNCTFTKWNTKLDGTGTTPGKVLKSNINLTLYAQWTNPTVGTLPTMTAQTLTFLGWYTAKTGGTKVTSATVIDRNITLYAHWATKTYRVTYYPGGGVNAPAAQTKTHGNDLTLTTAKPTKSFKINFDANAPLTAPAAVTRTCTFKNWNTQLNGTGTTYASGAVYRTDANLTVYAQWTNPTAGTLPTMTAQTLNFLGWYTAKTGGTKVTASTVLTGSVTLYAHWQAK